MQPPNQTLEALCSFSKRVSEAKSSPSTSRKTLHYLIYPQARLHQTLETSMVKFFRNLSKHVSCQIGENGVRWANFTKTFLKYTKFKSLKFLSLQIIQLHSFAIYILQNLRNVTTFCDRNVRLKFFGKMAQLTPHTGKVDPPSGGKLFHLHIYHQFSYRSDIFHFQLVI